MFPFVLCLSKTYIYNDNLGRTTSKRTQKTITPAAFSLPSTTPTTGPPPRVESSSLLVQRTPTSLSPRSNDVINTRNVYVQSQIRRAPFTRNLNFNHDDRPTQILVATEVKRRTNGAVIKSRAKPAPAGDYDYYDDELAATKVLGKTNSTKVIQSKAHYTRLSTSP